MDFASAILLFLGSVVVFTGALGLVRLPGFFNRLHAAGVIDTLGAWLVLGGLLVLYVLINGLQGSSALGILTASVIVGNAPSLADSVGMRKDTGLSRGFRNTHDQITFIIKSFF